MPGDLTYEVTIGSQKACSRKSDSSRQLLFLSAELGMGGFGGYCMIELADAEEAEPAAGDSVTVTFDIGQGMCPMFTGEVESVETTAVSQRITAVDGLVKLARLDVESVYENVTADFIVKDLLQQAGVKPGTLEKGPKLPSFAVFKGPRALRYVQNLAELCGVDLFTDGEGKTHFTGTGTSGSDHAFQYGENVREMCLKQIPAIYDSAVILGEGAAGSQGAKKYYWLPTDLSGVSARATLTDNGSVAKGKTGKRPWTFSSGALRSGEAAGNLAENRMKAAAARQVQGYIRVFGTPNVTPGDSVKINGLPAGHSAAGIFESSQSLRVRSVRHILDMTAGFITRMDF